MNCYLEKFRAPRNLARDPRLTNTLNRNPTDPHSDGAAWGGVIGMVVGGIIGYSFCGTPCGFIGSVVFGFIGYVVGGMS